MPCLHKFHDYLNLNKGYLNPELDHLDFEPTTLIVGTFNPSWPAGNQAQWFYGRTGNNYFWDVLPRLYGEDSLINQGPVQWREFCVRHRIAITDIIQSVDDANHQDPHHVEIMNGFADDDLVNNYYDFDLVNIVRLLRNHPTIQKVFVTRGITESFWKHKLFAAKRYCLVKGIALKSIITPSGYAYLQQGKHNRLNPHDQLTLPDYILRRWQQEWNHP